MATSDDKDAGGKTPSLDEFSERLDRMRGEEEQRQEPKGDGGWGRAMRASSDLFAGLLVGTLLGFLLDRWLGTSPWFFLAGIGLGFVAGLLNVMRSVK